MASLSPDIAHDLRNLVCVVLAQVDMPAPNLGAIREAALRARVLLAKPNEELVCNGHLFDLALACDAAQIYFRGEVKCDLSAGACPVAGAPVDFHRILLNLCVNAYEAGATELRVTTRRISRGRAAVEVADNGRGILDQAISPGGQGLTIVREAVARLQGEMEYGRLGRAGGTLFTLIFPVAENHN